MKENAWLVRAVLFTAAILSALVPVVPSQAATFSQVSDDRAPNKQQSPGDGPSVAFSGYFSTRYVYRTVETPSTGIERDQDVYAELRIDATTPRTNRYEFHFMGSVRKDLDGNRDLHANNLLEDIGDTGPRHTIGYLYEAHLDINDLFSRVTQIRMGRQAGTRDEQVYFDGIAMDIRAASYLKLTLYGGAAVNLFEIYRSGTDDTLAGAGVDIPAGTSTGISLDYLTIRDKRDYLQMTNVQDKLLSLKVWQRFTPSLKATARFRYQNGEARDLNVRLLGTFPGAGTEIGASYIRQFKTQGVQSNALSPFVDVVGQSDPYQSYEIKVRKFFGTRYAVDLLYFKRDLTGNQLPGAFNREYSRSAAGFEVADLFTRNLSLTLTGDQWKSQERSSSAAGADLGYTFGKKGNQWKVNAGTYYSLYKYDYYLQLGERDNVRTYYLNTKVPVAKQVAMNLSYEYERSLEKYQTVKAGIRYDF